METILAEYGGSVLLITHDRYLVRALSSRVWAIVDGQLRVFPEGYDAYRDWLAEQQLPTKELSWAMADRDAARLATRQAERAARRHAERVATLETYITQLEAKLAEISVKLEQASQQANVEEVRWLGEDYVHVETELEARLAEWMELSN